MRIIFFLGKKPFCSAVKAGEFVQGRILPSVQNVDGKCKCCTMQSNQLKKTQVLCDIERLQNENRGQLELLETYKKQVSQIVSSVPCL